MKRTFKLGAFVFSQLQKEAITNGHITQSTGTSSVGSKPRRYVVALHDYDPLLSGAPGRQPHEQLSFKKGDVMTSHGDVDVKGFYRVDLNGKGYSLLRSNVS